MGDTFWRCVEVLAGLLFLLLIAFVAVSLLLLSVIHTDDNTPIRWLFTEAVKSVYR